MPIQDHHDRALFARRRNARVKGRERFEGFVDVLGERLQSGDRFFNEISDDVARDVLKQFHEGRRSIMGLMLESHLQGGRQSWEPGKSLAYGMSITDPCLAWKDTEQLLYEVADSLAAKLV